MYAGYVYILINQSMSGLLKIGRTFRDSRERARELHSTGVPTPFELAFEIFSPNHQKLEKQLHHHLISFRVSSNREFFRYLLYEAIKLLQELNSLSCSNDKEEYMAESIYHSLVNKYSTYLVPEISDIRIVQTSNIVWLEIIKEEVIAGYLKDQIIRRVDLAFIANSIDTLYFNPQDSISINVNKFVNEFDCYSIAMVTDLFHDVARQEITSSYNT
jgi:hypothetical protein